jgi:hypothetical protein
MVETLKCLLSKYKLFGSENFSEDERLAVNLLYSKFLNQIQLNMIVLSELQKWGLQTLIKEINSRKEGLTNNAFLSSLHGILLFPNKFEYYGKLLKKNLSILIKMDLRPKRKHFERYIGVGYKDKGTATVESQNGFHSWQEITATSETKLNEIIRTNSLRLQSKEIKFQRSFKTFEFGIDRFGNPRRVDLENILIGNQVGYREVRGTEKELRDLVFDSLFNNWRSSSKYRSYFIAEDDLGRRVYISN